VSRKLLTPLLIKTLHIGARASQLSRVQVQEVCRELSQFAEELDYRETYVETVGDLDLATSLKTQEKSDFFTRELDQMLLRGEIDIAVHSAKDLPDPLPQGLCRIALTKGVDPRDALAFRNGESLESLSHPIRVGTSSLRREECVKRLGVPVEIVDIRGSVPARLELLNQGVIDALVVAEAALLRLGREDVPRLYLEGDPAPLQGRLAVLAKKEREDLKELFTPLDYTDD